MPDRPGSGRQRRREVATVSLPFHSGIMMPPMAAVVAGADPEIAANKVPERTVTIPKPPVRCPTKARATRIMRLKVRPVSIKVAGKDEAGDGQEVEDLAAGDYALGKHDHI